MSLSLSLFRSVQRSERMKLCGEEDEREKNTVKLVCDGVNVDKRLRIGRKNKETALFQHFIETKDKNTQLLSEMEQVILFVLKSD